MKKTKSTPEPLGFESWALDAAKEFRATVVGLSNKSTEQLAEIISKHAPKKH